MLEKTFNPAEVEERQYPQWENSGLFSADPFDTERQRFCIMMPPPNLTGSLHIGHALNMTLQDVLVRFHRMQGKDVLWQPGTDHASIAVQNLIEKQLEKEGTPARKIGREKFLEKTWEFVNQSGGTIKRQTRRLGVTPDWPRSRFTMDEGLSRSVLKVFTALYSEGLIYRAKRLVNWDPVLQTTLSDIEAIPRETKGKLWHIQYPIEGEEMRTITVATTRPETMLGDTAIAVHPEDERYKDLIGHYAVLPIMDRLIPIVADEYADPEHGSGAVKITPGHDFNDFEVGQRHNLEIINIFTPDARINENGPENLQGLDRFDARKKILEELEALDAIETVEEITHNVPYAERSNAVVEPYLTDQWFVDAHTMAQPAIRAVEEGETAFVPGNWENTYFDWMRNIQPWCISRQLWWGHRIPAWYGPDGHIFVAESAEDAQAQACSHYGKKDVELVRDEDVLDTWFSSALWPFSTLGWPEETPELQSYYPTDVLVTSFDIIFFWVARMMMMGLHFMKDVPFRTVYMHALVRDENGQKMSKSKGNIIDPLDLIDKYGADALRFTLISMAAQGRDIKLSEQRVAGYRNFATKLWNAARYTQMHNCILKEGFGAASCDTTLNRWIFGETVKTSRAVEAAIRDFKFNEAADVLYKFVWNTYCDWYLEFTKPVLQSGEGEEAEETRQMTSWVLEQILLMLNPIMPYVTEELHGQLGSPTANVLLLGQEWPELDDTEIDEVARAEIEWMIGIVGEIRSLRAALNIQPSRDIEIYLQDLAPQQEKWLQNNAALIQRLARVDRLETAQEDLAQKGLVQGLVENVRVFMPVTGLIDFEVERARLQKEIGKLKSELEKLQSKLANENFIANAPGDVVEETRQRREEARVAHDKLRQALEAIEAA